MDSPSGYLLSFIQSWKIQACAVLQSHLGTHFSPTLIPLQALTPPAYSSATLAETHEMPNPPESAYDTRLNILHAALETIDVSRLVEECKVPWYNQTLCQVNDSVVRLGVVQGEYHWHKHDTEDEFFYVVSGRFLIDLRDKTIELTAGQATVIPKGIEHRPRAPQRTVILMVEGAGIVPTGD